jgi:hypothetical protein
MAGCMAQMIEQLPSKSKALSSNPSILCVYVCVRERERERERKRERETLIDYLLILFTFNHVNKQWTLFTFRDKVKENQELLYWVRCKHYPRSKQLNQEISLQSSIKIAFVVSDVGRLNICTNIPAVVITVSQETSKAPKHLSCYEGIWSNGSVFIWLASNSEVFLLALDLQLN